MKLLTTLLSAQLLLVSISLAAPAPNNEGLLTSARTVSLPDRAIVDSGYKEKAKRAASAAAAAASVYQGIADAPLDSSDPDEGDIACNKAKRAAEAAAAAAAEANEAMEGGDSEEGR